MLDLSGAAGRGLQANGSPYAREIDIARRTD
jgi:hypothetical protein